MVRFPRRQRTSFSRHQLDILNEAFKQNQYPEAGSRNQLAEVTKLQPTRIQVWFQNQRAKYKKRGNSLISASEDVWSLGDEDSFEKRTSSNTQTCQQQQQEQHEVHLHHLHSKNLNHQSNNDSYSAFRDDHLHREVKKSGEFNFESTYDNLQMNSIYKKVELNIKRFRDKGIHLFNSEMANEAAQAVHEGKFDSMVQYHRIRICCPTDSLSNLVENNNNNKNTSDGLNRQQQQLDLQHRYDGYLPLIIPSYDTMSESP